MKRTEGGEFVDTHLRWRDVDTFLTTEQSQILLDWIVVTGKNLTAIYITHGHSDHFFGLAIVANAKTILETEKIAIALV
jgi:glyoxylase-like metal-dependent hydrolase (beta-lactamase superfamily II)